MYRFFFFFLEPLNSSPDTILWSQFLLRVVDSNLSSPIDTIWMKFKMTSEAFCVILWDQADEAGEPACMRAKLDGTSIQNSFRHLTPFLVNRACYWCVFELSSNITLNFNIYIHKPKKFREEYLCTRRNRGNAFTNLKQEDLK